MNGFMLGMHAIELRHSASEVYTFNQGPGGRDLVGLFVHGFDAQETLAGLSQGVDQR